MAIYEIGYGNVEERLRFSVREVTFLYARSDVSLFEMCRFSVREVLCNWRYLTRFNARCAVKWLEMITFAG